MRKNLLLILLLSAQALSAQTPRLYPASFLQLADNYSFDNPAYSSFHHYRDIKAINSFYTGLLKNVGLYYLDVSFTLNTKSQATHTGGLIIHSEYETELLKRNRVYLRYAWQTPIGKNIRLSAGTALGFFNYAVHSTASSPGSSVFVPDGMMGIWLNGKSFNAGISFNQFTNAEIRPINRTFSTGRYATFLSDYRFILSTQLKVLIAFRLFTGEANYRGAACGASFFLTDHFTAGAMFYYHQGTGFTLGLTKVKVASVFGDVAFSYFQPSSRYSALASNRMEIRLRAYLEKQ